MAIRVLTQSSMEIRRYGLAAVVIGGVLTLAGAFLLTKEFPYSETSVFKEIGNRTGAHITAQAFHPTWFPPGFNAERVRITQKNGAVLTIATVTLTGSYTGLLRTPRTVRVIDARGVHIAIPPGNRSFGGGNMSLAAGEIHLQDSRLEFLPNEAGKPPLTFDIRDLRLNDVGPGKASAFQVALHNPRPSGYVHAEGRFGPIDSRNARATPVSGAFRFDHADLTVDHGVTGQLNASGRFQGRLGNLECAGTADVPNFQVYGSIHPVHIASRFKVLVDAASGNANLEEIASHFNSTTVSAAGTVMSTPDRPGKTVTIDMRVQQGRVEDVLLLFTHADTPAMKGPLSLQGRFIIPPGPPDFLSRIRIDGRFEIAQAHFTNPRTQAPVNALSASAERRHDKADYPKPHDDPPLATGTIRSSVVDRNGVAALKDTVFEAPGIYGQLAGTFQLHAKALDLSGVMDTTGKMSDTTSGVKAVMLKALTQLWPKHESVRSVPFHIGGTASRPAFKLRLHQ